MQRKKRALFSSRISDAEVLRRYIIVHYDEIKAAKKLGTRTPHNIRQLIYKIQEVIYAFEAELDHWSLGCIMAYLFLINQKFHGPERDGRWEWLKERAQAHIVAKHFERVAFIEKGRFKGCYELAFDVWRSHWPKAVSEHMGNDILLLRHVFGLVPPTRGSAQLN